MVGCHTFQFYNRFKNTFQTTKKLKSSHCKENSQIGQYNISDKIFSSKFYFFMIHRINFQNEFIIYVKPFSKSLTSVTLQPKTYSINSLQKNYSGILETSTGQKHKSVSEVLFKPTYAELMLELKLLEKPFSSNCSFGQIKINTLLCWSSFGKPMPDCIEEEPRRYLQWEACLTSDMILYSANVLKILLPGQIYYVQIFRQSSERCCHYDTCFFQYRWKYIQNPILMGLTNFWARCHFVSTFSPSSIQINWYDTKHKCKERAQTIPIFFSYENLEFLIFHLRQLSLSYYVPQYL